MARRPKYTSAEVGDITDALNGMSEKDAKKAIEMMRKKGTPYGKSAKDLKADDKEWKRKTQGGFDPGGTVAGIKDFFKGR